MKYNVAVQFMILGLFCGCSGRPQPSYTIEVLNSTDSALQDIALVWGKATLDFHALAPTVSAGRLGVPHPFPPAPELSWQDQSGQTRHVPLHITNTVDTSFDGIVFIEIQPANEVTIRPMTYDAYEKLMAERKQNTPPNNTSEGIRQPADGLPKPSM